MKKALIVQGGWEGHEPDQVAGVFQKLLQENGFRVEISDTLDAFLDTERLRSLHLIIPIWTMGQISNEQVMPVLESVGAGVGMAGCHGGMCDSFRDSNEWQFVTGGQFVSHPGSDGVEHTVQIRRGSSPIVEGIDDFTVQSEQYFMHVDPSVEILATTRFPVVNWYHVSNGQFDMPVAWTKRWGHGRIFYCSLGHHADIFDLPPVLEIMRRGFLWAAEGKDIAVSRGLEDSVFQNDALMF